MKDKRSYSKNKEIALIAPTLGYSTLGTGQLPPVPTKKEEKKSDTAILNDKQKINRVVPCMESSTNNKNYKISLEKKGTKNRTSSSEK